MLTYSPRTLLAARLMERMLSFTAPLFARKPLRQMPSSPAILLIEPFQMGDVLSLAVMLDPLLQRFPQAPIYVWCHGRAAMVFANDSRVTQVISAPFPWSGRGSKRGTIAEWKAVVRSIAVVRRLHIDIAIDVRGDVRSQAVLLLGGCRERIGYTTYVGSNLHLRGLLLTQPLSPPASQHRFANNVATLAHLLSEKPLLTLPAIHIAQTPPSKTAPKLVVIHPGAGWRYRRWETARWADLITRLQQLAGLRLLQIAGPGEQELATELSAMLAAPIETLSTSFDGLMKTLAEATVFIGLDSGPMNAANLLNTPVVALFGPGIASMWHPLSRGSAWLQHIEDYPCHPCTQIVCVRPNDPCMTTITVDEVFAEAVRLLEEDATT